MREKLIELFINSNFAHGDYEILIDKILDLFKPNVDWGSLSWDKWGELYLVYWENIEDELKG